MMSRALALPLCLLALASCRLPPDRQPLKPLPDDGQVYSYEELLSRARVQATAALEAFYVDNWPEVEEAAVGLEQTARFLPRATDPPAKHKKNLESAAGLLAQEAVHLRAASKARDVDAANQALQRINNKIRLLRTDNEPPQPQEKTDGSLQK